MRHQKIRGHNRRYRQIENWRLENIDLRTDLIEKYNGYHIDIVVHPWCDLSIINSDFKEPKGKTKQLMLNGLIDIYDSWKVKLDTLGKSYYLKIWIFEPRFSKSQVVCAVADSIEFYENHFFKPDDEKVFKSQNYGHISERLIKFDWDYCLDEDHFDNCFVGEPELYTSKWTYAKAKKWFNKLLKRPHRVDKYAEPDSDVTELYSFKRGDLWIGGQK